MYKLQILDLLVMYKLQILDLNTTTLIWSFSISEVVLKKKSKLLDFKIRELIIIFKLLNGLI